MIRTLFAACFLLAWFCGIPGGPAPVAAATPEECAKMESKDARLGCCSQIESKDDRLRCYDDLAKPKISDAAVKLNICTTEGEHAYPAARLSCYDDKAGYKGRICWFLGGNCWPSSLCEKVASSYLEKDGLDDCRETCDDTERLAKYDELTKYYGRDKPSTSSYLSQLWLLDEVSRRKAGRWAILAHRENYFIYTYNGHLDKQPYESANPGTSLHDDEAKFQLSLKMKLWEDIFGDLLKKKVDLWVGYTQLSIWQMLNWNNSAPFRETNYEPEVIFNIRVGEEITHGDKPIKLQFIQFVPINHQSNGQSASLSRSWNRSMLNFGVEKEDWIRKDDSLDFLLKTWYRWPESADSDDNPDIESYLGYGELWANYRWKSSGLNYHASLMFRNNLRLNGGNLSTLQLGFDSTLFGPLNWYIQYFTGYGETLIDYNHYTNRIGLGVMIRDW